MLFAELTITVSFRKTRREAGREREQSILEIYPRASMVP